MWHFCFLGVGVGGGEGLRFVFPCLFVGCVRVFAGGKKQSRTRTPRLVWCLIDLRSCVKAEVDVLGSRH